MSITSLKNKISKRIMKKESKNDYSEIGVFIKKRRKELNLTQDIICNGICSVSYLSKIENGQIEPNEFFIRELITKLDIEEDYLQKSLEDQSYLSNMLRHFFYLDDQQMELLYREIEHIEENLTIDVCKFGYQLYSNKYVSSNHVVTLENLVVNMSDKELKSYLFFSSIYFIQNDDYKTALEILLLSLDVEVQNDFLHSMIEEYLYYVKQRLLKKNCSLHHFDEAMRVYNKYLNSKRSVRLMLNRIKYVCDENPSHADKLLNQVELSLLHGFNYEYYSFLKAKICFILESYNEAIMYLSNIKEDSLLFMSKTVLLYEICLLEEDNEMIEELSSIINGISLSKIDLREKVYFNYLTQRNEENTKEYLRDIAIPYSIKTSDYKNLKFYIDVIMDLCISKSRYKEATQYYKKFIKEIKRVEKILYTSK